MSLLNAINELINLIQADPNFIDWLNQYGVRDQAVTVLKTNRPVNKIPDHWLPALIVELPEMSFGDRAMGNAQQAFNHEIDLLFAIQVDRDNYEGAFDARVNLIDQVLPKFFLKTDRLAQYVNDVKIIKGQGDQGVHFPKVFTQVTLQLTGSAKRD